MLRPLDIVIVQESLIDFLLPAAAWASTMAWLPVFGRPFPVPPLVAAAACGTFALIQCIPALLLGRTFKEKSITLEEERISWESTYGLHREIRFDDVVTASETVLLYGGRRWLFRRRSASPERLHLIGLDARDRRLLRVHLEERLGPRVELLPWWRRTWGA